MMLSHFKHTGDCQQDSLPFRQNYEIIRVSHECPAYERITLQKTVMLAESYTIVCHARA